MPMTPHPASPPSLSRPLTVLMVSDVYFPRINGVSTSIETFRRTLADLGVTVRLVAPAYDSVADATDTADDTLWRVPGRPVPRDPEDRLMAWRKLGRTVAEAAEGADLIHVQTPFLAHYAGVAEARRRGVPVFATYHTFFEEYLHHYAPFLPGALLRGLARRLSRHQCNGVDEVVVPSRAMAERLSDYGVTAPLTVLPTGIPMARFDCTDTGARAAARQRFRQAHGIAPERPVALFVGRVAFEKNIAFLLEAHALARRHLPELLLLVTGEGPARPALERHAASLGLGDSVRFLGYLERERALPDCYAAADAFAFASHTETQGLVLLEALAAGLPVVALAEMGTRDILLDRYGHPMPGCVVPRAEVADFALRLADLLGGLHQDPHARLRLEREARGSAAGWSDQALAARLAERYHARCAVDPRPALLIPRPEARG